MKIKAHLEMPNSNELIKNMGLDKGGRVQKYIDNFVLTHSENYMPKKTGKLIQSGHISTKLGSGSVVWSTPYANYQYEGNLMVDPTTQKGAFFSKDYGFWSRPNTQKILDPQGKNLNYTTGGAHWFDEMIKNEMDDLVEGIYNTIDGGNK